MKSKFANFIMSIIVILIIAVICIFGAILWKEFSNLEVAMEPEDFQTVISERPKEDVESQNIMTPNIVENSLDKLENMDNDKTQKVDYSQVNVDRFFYNQLGEESKTIYKALEANRENMKTGTHKIELGDTFSDLLSTDNGQTRLGEYYQSAIEAYTYDNPDIFYLSPNKMYLNIEKTTSLFKTTYNVFINSGEQPNYLVSEFPSKSYVDDAISKVESAKKDIISKRTGDIYDDIRIVHDYLVDTIEYDTSISQPNIYNAYGALINRLCVCEGYARAFKYIMDDMNIPCVLVIGKATNSKGETENHAWNYVNVKGAWYAIDTTWDDPVVLNGGKATYASKYKYFLKGSNTMSKDHTPSGQFTEGGKVFNYPTLSNSNYQ